MGTATDATSRHVIVEISEDRMTARLKLRTRGDVDPPSSQDVLAALKQAHISLNDQVKKWATEFVRLAGSGKEIRGDFIVAEGKPANEGRDEELAWDPAFAKEASEWQADAKVNYYTLNSITTVEADTVIGTITSLVPSEDGVDVTGKLIPPRHKPQRYELDKTIRRASDNPAKIISCVPGKVVERGRKLKIDEVLTVSGDVSFATGNIDATTDVYVAGAVPDRFEVKSAKSVTVKAAIEAALVTAEEDVVVGRGIVGRNAGKVRAGGEIIAKFCAEADLTAAKDIKIGVQLMSSRVRTNGRLLAECAALIGGHVYAREGAEVASIGSEAAVPTRLFLGVRPDALQQAEAITARLEPTRQAIERTRTMVKPLLDNLKRLTPAQREQATELMFKAEEAAASIADEEQRRDEILEAAGGKTHPKVLVSGILYPRVTISVGPRVMTFDTELKGPITIELRQIKNVTEMVAVNNLTASVKVLPSQVLPIKALLVQFAPLHTPQESAE